MARKHLTSNRRSFRGKQRRSFLNEITESPINVTINDGVNPEYTIVVDPMTSRVKSSDSPPGVSVGVERPPTNRDDYPDPDLP